MREAQPRLPGIGLLAWLLFMQPLQLHHLLRELGIPPYGSLHQILRAREVGRGVRRDFLVRMFAMLVVSSSAAGLTVVLASAAAALLTLPSEQVTQLMYGVTIRLALSVAGGVIIGVAGSVVLGVANSVAVGVAFSTLFGIAVAVADRVVIGSVSGEAFAVIFSVPGGVALGVVCGVVDGVGRGAADSVASSVAIGVAYGVMLGVYLGMTYDVSIGMVHGVSFAVSCIGLIFRLPIWPLEALIQILFYQYQEASGRVTLGRSPVFWHDLSYLPHPFLRRHILDTAEVDPTLTRQVVERCASVPGQRRIGRSALLALQARELELLARKRDFLSVSELRGTWLPGIKGAPPTLLGFQEVASYLRAAQAALVPEHRLTHISNAARELVALRNRLLAGTSEDARAFRQAVGAWSDMVAGFRAEAETEAALRLPNPFRPGEPLTPEQGMDVFRGREEIIRRIEALLGDASTSASLVLLAPRRCGKTTLLNMLPMKLPDTLSVFFDIQDNPVGSLDKLVEALVERAQEQALRTGKPQVPALPDGDPIEALSRWLRELDGSYPVARVLIAFDEFERLAAGKLWPGTEHQFLQFMGLLRATIQHRRRIRLLVSGAAAFDELAHPIRQVR